MHIESRPRMESRLTRRLEEKEISPMNDISTTPRQAIEQHPHVAIITTAALKHGRAIYYGASFTEADRALRVWFAVFATEQSILIGLPPVASRRADAAP